MVLSSYLLAKCHSRAIVLHAWVCESLNDEARSMTDFTFTVGRKETQLVSDSKSKERTKFHTENHQENIDLSSLCQWSIQIQAQHFFCLLYSIHQAYFNNKPPLIRSEARDVEAGTSGNNSKGNSSCILLILKTDKKTIGKGLRWV